MSLSRHLPSQISLALRSSQLSRRQFQEFAALWLQNWPSGSACPELVELTMDSPGDRDKQRSLLDPELPADFFTRDLDQAVLTGQASAALHSAKDLPWPLPPGLEVWALTPAECSHDELCSPQGWTLETLPPGARIGTSSPQRQAKLLALRPDLQIISLRGTIAERLAYLDDGRADAVVVAACALRRLELPPGIPLPFDTHPLQGHLAVVGPRVQARLRHVFSSFDIRAHWGTVALVGAGPGPADYLTLQARQLLDQADIVYYDALLDPTMLEGLRAELVFVGKRRGHHEKTQDETNELLYQSAKSGRRVVRLKGGDPLVFGRGSEEAAFLGSRLVDYQIVSGVSSAMAAAACAGIPLSERGKAASIALINSWPAEKLRWTAADTQVFYMPSAAAAEISRLGIAAGADGQLGVAWVRGAGSQHQSLSRGKLADLGSLEPPDGDEPVLLIAGPTIDARAGNDWFDRLPRILNTGAASGLGEESPGPFRGRISHHPFIRFEVLSSSELAGNPEFHRLLPPFQADWLVFTSPRSVSFYFQLLEAANLDSRCLAGLKIAAIGHSSAAALAKQGIRADLQPSLEHSQGLIAAFAERGIQGQRILLPRSDHGLDLIPAGLRQLGNQVYPLVLYRTLAPAKRPDIIPEEFEEVIFSSPSTVENFFAFFPKLERAWLSRVFWHTRGPQTRSALDRILQTRLGHYFGDQG